MGSSVKRFRASSNRSKSNRIVEGFDEENRIYFTVLERPVEKRSKQPPNASLKDVPLETRRKEARKPMYIARYE